MVKRICFLVLVCGLFPVRALGAEITYDQDQKTIPLELYQEKTNANINDLTSKKDNPLIFMPKTGEVLQMGLSFVGTLLVGGTVLSYQRRRKDA